MSGRYPKTRSKESIMKRTKKITDAIWLYVGLFLLSVLLYIAVLVIEGAYPFGERCFFVDDAYVQYNTMLRTLIRYVENGADGVMLWDRGLGVDMYLTGLYYLMSPFNVIALILGEANVELSLTLIIIIKCSLLPVTALYYFRHTAIAPEIKDGKEDISLLAVTCVQLVLAFAYGFCGYVVAYGQNIIWLDGLIMMPILAIFVERVCKGEKYAGYTILLALTFAVNFYYAFYMCMFIVVYYIIVERDGIKEFFTKGFILLGLSVLAAAMAGAVLVPAARCVLSMGESGYIRPDTLDMWGDIGDYAVSFFPFKEVTIGYMFNNNNYMGSLAVLLFFVFMCASHISVWSRVKYLLVSLVFIVAANFLPLNYIFHGCVITHGIGNRFAIILTFIMLVICYSLLMSIDRLKVWNVAVGGTLAVGLLVLSFFCSSKLQVSYCYVTFLCVIAVGIIVLVLVSRKSIRACSALVILSVIWFAELTCNTLKTMPPRANDESMTSYISLANWQDEYDSLTLEKGQRKTALVYEDYTPNSQVNWYSSMINGYTVDAFASMGLAHFDNVECVYDGTTPLTAMMYNVRYVLSASSNSCGGYTEVESNDLYSVYEADTLAGMGFMADEAIASWTDCGDVGLNQSSFLSFGFGDQVKELQEQKVLKPYPWQSLEDSSYNIKESYNLGDFKKIGVGEYIYQSNSMYSASVHLNFTAAYDMELYVYSEDTRDQIVMVYVYEDSEDPISSQTLYYISGQLVYGGHIKKGQKVKVAAFGGGSNDEKAYKRVQLYSFDSELFEKVKPYITDEILECDSFGKASGKGEEAYGPNEFRGHVKALKDGVLYMAFPYNEGYEVLVDGKKSEKLLLGKGNMGVRLTKGYHEITLRYRTPGLTAGIVISLVAFAIYLLLFVWRPRNNGKK